MKEKKSPCQRGPTRGRDGLFSQVGHTVGIVLFGLAAGDDDRGSAEDEDDTGHVEDRGTDAASGGQLSTRIVLYSEAEFAICRLG